MARVKAVSLFRLLDDLLLVVTELAHSTACRVLCSMSAPMGLGDYCSGFPPQGEEREGEEEELKKDAGEEEITGPCRLSEVPPEETCRYATINLTCKHQDGKLHYARHYHCRCVGVREWGQSEQTAGCLARRDGEALMC